mgnify:CR=1 FL=1
MKLILGDCLEELKKIEDNSIDCVITSPPYDNLRTYKDTLEWGEHIWKPIIKDLFRVLKQGGVIVWVVGDATIKGSETGTSFRQALWAKECGFNLHDTMIYVTHDQVEAMTMGDRICVLNFGKIMQVDTPLNLYNNVCSICKAFLLRLRL